MDFFSRRSFTKIMFLIINRQHIFAGRKLLHLIGLSTSFFTERPPAKIFWHKLTPTENNLNDQDKLFK